MVLGLIPDCDLAQRDVGRQRGRHRRADRAPDRAPRAPRSRASCATVEKIETAVEPRFQEHFVHAMAIPHDTDPYERLARSVPLPRPGGQHRPRGARGAVPARRQGGGGPTDDRDTQKRAAAAPHGRRRACTPTSSASRSSPAPSRPSRCCPRRGSRRSRRTPTGSSTRSGSSSATPPTRSSASPGAGADVQGERVRFPHGLCRSIVQATAPSHFTQVARNRANDVVFGGQGTRSSPRLRLAVRPRPRRRPPLRHDRGLPQLREARLRLAVAPPLGRHRLRAGRRAGQQAPPRHGLRAHALLGQAVHGLGHAPERAARHGRRWRGSCSASDFVDEHTVIISLINANSPLVWDATMLGAAQATPRRTRP